ncbi:radical SAM/SPASM domain-containing protein [Cetobacterium sp.]|uniref:radical SAM/SPASM domain-containing protein n=1 Tax=Cetobacterium sp. TaxID=2071632 RepID=UPI002FC5AEE0
MKENKKYLYLVLWLANYCNLDCDYCYAKNNFGTEKMSWIIAKQGLELLDEKATLILAGGEPLLNFPLIETIYTYLKEKNFKGKIAIQTNGTLITDDIAYKLSKMHIKIGVSLDGMFDTNECSRGETKKVITGIRNLEKYNKDVSINCVLTGENIGSLEALVEFLYLFKNINGLGLDLIRITPKTKFTIPKSKDLYINLKKAYDKTIFLGNITGKFIPIREIEDTKQRLNLNYHSCNYCYSSIGQTAVILPNGDVYPCSSLVGEDEYFMGNIESKKLNSIRLSSGKSLLCEKCRYEKICRGSCPSRIIMNTKYFNENSDCNLRKAIFKILEN